MTDILKGITVLDLTQNIAGPFCTQLLGDFGADVIKVERPETGDDTRSWTRDTWNGVSTTFLTVNRNKKSVCVDIGADKGVDVIRRLASKAQVFIHAVRQGSLETRGLGYEDLKSDNPGLVYCAISAFGAHGPRAADPGYDALIQAYSGIMSVTGHPDRPPARAGVSILDLGTGVWAFSGILAALYRRKDTGKGANVTASLMETGVSLMSVLLTQFMANGVVSGRYGDATPFAAPYESFATKDGAVLIVAFNDGLFRRTCQALGISHLVDDPRFNSLAKRVDAGKRAVLHGLLEERTAQLTTAECVTRMREAGAACSPINSVDAVYRDEQVNAIGMIRALPASYLPELKTVDVPVSIDGERAGLRQAPPRLGAHTDEVLGWAGYPAEEIAALRSCKAVS